MKKDEVQASLKEARRIVDHAKAEGRELNRAEKAQVDDILAKAEEHTAKVETRDRVNDVGRRVKTEGSPLPEGGSRILQPAYGSKEDPLVRAWVKEVASAINFADGKIEGKALTVPSPVGRGADDGPYGRASAPVDLIDLFTIKQSDSAEEQVLRQSARTNAAAPVAKGAAKPESAYTLERVSIPMETIAHLVSGVANQDLADMNRLEAFVTSELLLGLRAALESQIINGSGTSPQLEGIIQDAAVGSQTFSTSVVNTIRKAKTQLETLGYNPNAVVLLPSTAEALDLLQAAGGAGEYLYGGPASSDGAQMLWGMRVVISNSLPAATALVGDFPAAGFLFSRQAAAIDVDPYSKFDENETRFRAELRAGLALTRPQALIEAALA